MNRTFLLGHLGRNPELRYTPTQHPVCDLRVATHERRKMAEGEWGEHTEWHNVVVWGAPAENCAKYLTKGRQVLVEGRLRTRTWEDPEGATRSRTEIVAESVQFLGGKPGETAASGEEMLAPVPGPESASFVHDGVASEAAGSVPRSLVDEAGPL